MLSVLRPCLSSLPFFAVPRMFRTINGHHVARGIWIMERSLLNLQGSDEPQTLVENRTSFGGQDVQFSIYDTYQRASRVALRSSYPLYCGMVTGKKVIHLDKADAEPFDFLPGESLVVPPLETIHIDFPESDTEPTKCITLEIDTDKVSAIVDRLNEDMPREPDAEPWDMGALDYCHFPNPGDVEEVLGSLVRLFDGDTPHRDVLVDLNAARLIVHMLQTRARTLLLDRHSKQKPPSRGIAAAVHHIKKHYAEALTVSDLAEVAIMSESSFYRYFRNELGMTPLQYLTEVRMERAKTMLCDDADSVTEVSHAVGFSSTSHFISTFKDHVGLTPKQFQMQCAGQRAPSGKGRQ
jgi:AraC-like DNA-binding protein